VHSPAARNDEFNCREHNAMGYAGDRPRHASAVQKDEQLL
jgi:hypothetical protein